MAKRTPRSSITPRSSSTPRSCTRTYGMTQRSPRSLQDTPKVYGPTIQKKKGRGPTKGIAIAKKVRNAGVKLPVIISEEKLRAVGINAENFISELGLKVRQNAPLDANRWKKVPKAVKAKIIALMREHFVFSDSKIVENAIASAAGDLYRTWRARLHKHYQKFETNEERLQNPHQDTTDEDWKKIVAYFSTEGFKAMSIRNKRSRAQQMVNHICGRKSFQSISYAVQEKTGKEPNVVELWKMTHVKSNGIWVDDRSKEIYENVLDIFSQQAKEGEGEGEDEGVNQMTIDDAFFKVVGEKSGYIRGQGRGPKPIGTTTQQFIHAQVAREMENMREKIREEICAERTDELQAKIREELRAEMEVDMSFYVKRSEIQLMVHSLFSQMTTQSDANS